MCLLNLNPHFKNERKKISRLICTAAVPACRSAPIDGKAGRYMSIANGPIADNRPSTTAMRRNLGLMIVASFEFWLPPPGDV